MVQHTDVVDHIGLKSTHPRLVLHVAHHDVGHDPVERTANDGLDSILDSAINGSNVRRQPTEPDRMHSFEAADFEDMLVGEAEVVVQDEGAAIGHLLRCVALAGPCGVDEPPTSPVHREARPGEQAIQPLKVAVAEFVQFWSRGAVGDKPVKRKARLENPPRAKGLPSYALDHVARFHERPSQYSYDPHVNAGSGPDTFSGAAEVLHVEAQALLDAAERLEPDVFRSVVHLVAACSGKVILTGAGTSGIIARKLAATLTSTGTPSIFLHPSDALHGGLGAVTSGDVVIAVSNSGETGEVLALLPYLRSRRVALISIVGTRLSSLARVSDAFLDASVSREACPFDLAPTASTTVAMALGDAVAVAVLLAKGLTPETFALNHPSGRLGRRLTLRVADLMHSGDRLPTVDEDCSWLEVVTAISDGGLGAVVVVDGKGRLSGIVTDGDVRRTLQRAPADGLRDVVASRMMTSSPVSVPPDLLAYDALQQMEDRPSQISVLPVVADDGRCVGMIRVHDLVRAGV